MGDISEHFSEREVSCQCGCGYMIVNQELVGVLESIRAHFNEQGPCKIVINSWCRCEEHNERIGGAKFSQHIPGRAADFRVVSTDPDNFNNPSPGYIYDYLNSKYPDKYGIGKYVNRIHIDVRHKKARWINYNES